MLLHLNNGEGGSVAYVDGSFDGNGKGGTAFILHQDHTLLRYEIKGYKDGVSPFHMETCALLMAIRVAVDFRLEECVFFTDSELLVQTLEKSRNFRPLHAMDWQSYNQLLNISYLLTNNQKYVCKYISREENQTAHLLSNRARIDQFAFTGSTYPLFPDIA